jgi:hypothetical protein
MAIDPKLIDELLGDIFFRDVYIQVLPQPAQAAERLLRAPVLLFQGVHKVQYFLLLLRRQIAEFFDNLLFNRFGSHSGGLWLL